MTGILGSRLGNYFSSDSPLSHDPFSQGPNCPCVSSHAIFVLYTINGTLRIVVSVLLMLGGRVLNLVRIPLSLSSFFLSRLVLETKIGVGCIKGCTVIPEKLSPMKDGGSTCTFTYIYIYIYNLFIEHSRPLVQPDVHSQSLRGYRADKCCRWRVS